MSALKNHNLPSYEEWSKRNPWLDRMVIFFDQVERVELSEEFLAPFCPFHTFDIKRSTGVRAAALMEEFIAGLIPDPIAWLSLDPANKITWREFIEQLEG